MCKAKKADPLENQISSRFDRIQAVFPPALRVDGCLSMSENGIRFNSRGNVRISSKDNLLDKNDQRVLKRREEKMGRHPRKPPAGSPTRKEGLSLSSVLNRNEPSEKAEIDLSTSGAGSGTAGGVLARGDKPKAKSSYKKFEERSTCIYREKLKHDPNWQEILEGIGVESQTEL